MDALFPEPPALPEFSDACLRAARLAAALFGSPGAALCIRTASGEWSAFRHGAAEALPADLSAFCSAVRSHGYHTAKAEPSALPLVGHPLRTRDGRDVGVLCVAAAPDWSGEPAADLLSDLAATLTNDLASLPGAPSAVPPLNALLLEHTPDLLCAFDREGMLLQVSASSRDILGYEPAEMIGRSYAAFIHPDDAPLAAEQSASVLATGAGLRHFDTRYTHKDGSLVYLEWSTSWLEEEGVGYGVGRDVTELKQAEAALRESEERYRIVIEQTGQIVYDYDVLNGRIEWQGAVETTTGYTPEAFAEFGLSGWADHVHPEDRPQVLERLRQSQERVSLYDDRYRFRCADGKYRHIEERGLFLPGTEGRAVRMLGVMRDVTAQEKAEAAVRESEARIRATLEALPDLMFRLSRTGDHLDFHAPNESMLAVPGEQILGKNIRDLLPADVADVYVDRIDRVIRTGAPQTVEYDLVVATGEERSFEAHLALSSLDEVVVIVRDVTERKLYEAELVAARERAEEMNRLKSAFLANMSHEIRTPLTSIIGFADLLADTVAGEGREHAELIRSAGHRLLGTLNSVLDLAQLESGTLRLRPAPLDFVREAREVLNLFHTEAQARGVRLEFAPARHALPGTQDRGAVSRVLTNLVGNAVKFTARGTVTVSVRQAGPDVEITVADMGIGISPDFLPHLFEDFRQESVGLSRTHEGNGLGLAITRRLVEMMGGAIGVESTVGAGSTFTVRLPLRSGTGADAEAVPAPPESAGPARPRVLVVDDLPEARLLVARMLAGLYDVETAATYDEAVDKARTHPFDAVLLDVNLSAERSGLDVLRALRATAPYARTPILACTAYALPGDEQRMRDEGFDGYASKPLLKAGLLTLLGRFLPPARA